VSCPDLIKERSGKKDSNTSEKSIWIFIAFTNLSKKNPNASDLPQTFCKHFKAKEK
jgi:hypothetical protein